MTAVVFLDMDGVLVTDRSHAAMSHGRRFMLNIDPIGLGLVRRLCEGAGAKLVLSSSWRESVPQFAMDAIFANLGWPSAPWHQNWCTPSKRRMSEYVGRGAEIKRWMDDSGVPERYLILDDDNDMLPEQQASFVKTSFEEGITWADFLRACEILGVNPR